MFIVVLLLFSALQLLIIFIHEKLSSFVQFYNSNKEFVDGLGKNYSQLLLTGSMITSKCSE